MKLSKLIALVVLVCFSLSSFAAVAQSIPKGVSERADAAFAEVDERTAEVADDGIALPTQDNMVVNDGGVAVISPVNVEVNVLPPPEEPLVKKWWLWTIVGLVVTGVVVGGVCGSGNCVQHNHVQFQF